MRFLFPKILVCSAPTMMKIMSVISSSGDHYRYDLVNQLPADYGDVYLFRSGAVLTRVEKNRYVIKTYAAGETDLAPARAQLEAAFLVVQAIRKENEVNQLLGTAKEFIVEYRGLWGEYPGGHEVRKGGR